MNPSFDPKHDSRNSSDIYLNKDIKLRGNCKNNQIPKHKSKREFLPVMRSSPRRRRWENVGVGWPGSWEKNRLSARGTHLVKRKTESSYRLQCFSRNKKRNIYSFI